MQGKIIKGISGFYYVHDPHHGIYECKARGIFRKDNIKPLVGDLVEFEITDEEDKEGNVTRILPRRNALVRPAVANVDQAVILFAVAQPAPNFNMLDRFLIQMQRQGVPSLICFNKTDVADQKVVDDLKEMYRDCGCPLFFTSVKEQVGLDSFREALRDRTTVIAGPSGVGKSSLMNYLKPDAGMETGDISRRIQRGKHTTRHSELFCLEGSTYVMDTPGFTSLYLEGLETDELKEYYPEFEKYEGQCRFGSDCAHISEPDCAVKNALSKGLISKERYQSYCELYEELKSQRKY